MIVQEITILAALTLSSAFCSSSEIAFFSLPASRIKSFALSTNPKKQLIAKLLKQSTSLLVTIFMLNTIVNVLLQNSASHLFEQFEGGWWLKVGFPLLLVLLFGELIPKYLGLHYNERLAQYCAKTIAFLQKIATPFRVAITSISTSLSRIFFFFLQAEPPLSKEELEHILENSEGKGLVHRDETACILGVLSLEQKQVRELMLIKSKMHTFDIQEPISKLIYLFSEYRLDEIAVIEKPEEQILGIITAVTLFVHRAKIHSGQDLIPFLKRPFFVPETTSAKSLLEQFGDQNISHALVVDEYGQMIGTVSDLDLVAQIARASKSQIFESDLFKRVSDDVVIAQGSLLLDDMQKLFDVEFESVYHQVTLGGWLIEKLGTIPKSSTVFETNGLLFRILEADPKQILQVYIQKLPKQTLKSSGPKQ